MLRWKKYDKAIESFLKAEEILPENPIPYQRLGVAYRWDGQFDKAIQYFNKAIEKDPDESITYASLGHLYAIQGEYEKSRDNIEEFKNKSEPFAEITSAYYLIASTYILERDFGRAFKVIDELESNCITEENKYEELYSVAMRGFI